MGVYSVLLPVQLETRFIPPGTSAEHPGEPDDEHPEWRLRLRVVPDRASIAARQTPPAAAELVALQALVSTLAHDPGFPDPVPPEPELRRAALAALAGWTDAFVRLAAVVGPARASLLVDTVEISGRPPVVPEASALEGWQVPEVLGLPDRIEVWALWTGADPDAPVPLPEVLTVLEPQAGLLSLDPVPKDAADDLDTRWWGSWQAACDAGLAAEIPLARDPSEIEVLGVSGAGAADGIGAAELFTAHAEAGDLAVLRAGVPTSTVFGAPAADVVNAGDWSNRTGGGHDVLDVLAGRGAVGGVPIDPLLGVHEDWSRRIMSACYPSLWGYGLQGVLAAVRDPRDPEHRPEHAQSSLALWGWATDWLRPEGGFPPIRIGDQAYGVLALAAPSDEVVEGLGQASSAATDPLVSTPLSQALGRIARRWAAAAEVGLAQPDAAIRRLVHGPVPARLRRQDLIPVVTDAIRSQLDALDELERTWAERREVVRILDQEDLGWRSHGRMYRAFGPSSPLTLPILGPGLDGGSQPVEPQVLAELLEAALSGVHTIEELGITGLVRRDLVPDSLLLRLYQRSVAVSSQLLWNADPTGAVTETDPIARLGLLEPLGAPPFDSRAHVQAQRLAAPGQGVDVDVPDFLPRAVDPGGVAELLEQCASTPELRPIAHRAVRALVDAASGRWDVWLASLGSAHAADAVGQGSTPELGVYGWVDAPFRGTPGPGPGGFRIAPSRAIAGTLAVVRDRAVVDPDRWAMGHDTAIVGEARRWIADLQLGWHPAELLGRMIEQRIAAAPGVSPAQAAVLMRDLRKAHPLTRGQGGFGCTHGLDAIASLAVTADAVVDAVAHVQRMLDAAADLELVEGVHGILTDRPARAAAAMQGLSGTAPMPVPTWMEPEQPARAVETVVLLALPPAAPPPDAGPASIAAPGLDAHLRAAFAGDAAWVVEVGGRRRRITPADLDCSLLDVATLEPAALHAVAALAAAGGRGSDTAEPLTSSDADPLVSPRAWTQALRGRAAGAAEVAPELQPAERAAQQAAAADALRARLIAAVDDAVQLRERLGQAVADAGAAEESRLTAALAAVADGTADAVRPVGDEPLPTEEAEQLAALAVDAARWGFAPPHVAEQLGGTGAAVARRAAADLIAFLSETIERLDDRITDARRLLDPPVVTQSAPAPPIATRSDPDAVAAALATLVGRPRLPIGTPLTASVALEPAGQPLAGWARTVAAVRPDLASALGAGEGPGGALEAVGGLAVFATGADDPWREAELARLDERPTGGGAALTLPTPRLTVALAPALPAPGAALEWTVLDAFAEQVPTTRPVAGASFDAATPSARPPQAILIVPPADVRGDRPSDEELRGGVLYARMLAHGRMAAPADLEAAGVGALAAWAALPQDELTGAPLSADQLFAPTADQPALLVPDPDDGDDLAAAVTADALWMLGQQWRLGEHAGEDAATPLQLRLSLRSSPLGSTAANPAMPIAETPLEAAIEAEEQPGTAQAWRSESLQYASQMQGGPALDLPAHDAGRAGWWSLTAAAPPPDGAPLAEQSSRPGRLTWPGAPTGRYWQIEDRRTDAAGAGPDRTQPAMLHLIDVLARVGEDLFVAPVAAQQGTLVRPTGVTMTDAAGGIWPLRSPRDWNLIGIAGADPEPPDAGEPGEADWHRATAILAGTGSGLEGAILEDVALALDEDDNLLWVADLQLTDVGPPGETAAPVPLDDTAPALWRWTLRRAVPRGRYPYPHGFAVAAPADGAGEDAFLRAELIDVDGSVEPPPQSRLLVEMARLAPLAVPASGIRLVRRAMLARGVSGRPVLWHRRAKRPRDVPVDVDLRWDAFERAETADPDDQAQSV